MKPVNKLYFYVGNLIMIPYDLNDLTIEFNGEELLSNHVC